MVIWNDTHLPEERANVLQQLCTAYGLQIISGSETEMRSKIDWQLWKKQAWQDLYDSIDAMVSTANEMRAGPTATAKKDLSLKKMTIFWTTGPDARMWHMISQLKTLTILRIHGITQVSIDLGCFLRSCPNLIDLHIEPQWLNRSPSLTDTNYPEVEENEENEENNSTLQVFKLQTLELFNFWLDPQQALEHYITCLPNLKTLKLARTRCRIQEDGSSGLPLENHRGFWDHVARHCPKLEAVHYSTYNTPLDHVDMIELLERFPSVSEWSIGASNLTWTIVDALRNRNCIAAMTSDSTIGHTISAFAFQTPFTVSPVVIVNHLTTLEILSDSQLSTNSSSAHALHNYLCCAPTLLHLRASAIRFPVEYFDVASPSLNYPTPHHGYDEVDIDLEPEEAMLIVPGGTIKPYWTCHNLQTLQIRFDELTSKHIKRGSRLRWSRLIFSYISRLCPLIRDLSLDHSYIPVALDGGLCILSQLKDLVRVELLVSEMLDMLEAKDVEWMRQYPSTFGKIIRSIKQGGQFNRSNGLDQVVQAAGARFFPDEFPIIAPSTTLSVEEAKAMYDIGSVKSVLNALKRDSNGGCIWPQME
ncbi:hypothetical protein BGZ46_001416, partial [Entomortierella lignicola]